jgi:hypothetical protein
MRTNIKVAAAIAAVLGSGAAMAQQTAQSPFVSLFISGSSAAKPGIMNALTGPNVCGGTFGYYYSTTDTNFFAVSCAPPASTGLPGSGGSNIYTIWYRDEGGSVTGALPLVSGAQINQLLLTGATSSACPASAPAGTATCFAIPVAGSSAVNGIDDSFGSGVFKAPVQLGITDVEPGALVGNNYPTAYKSTVYGHATSAQMANLNSSAQAVFGQVFGIFVNTNSGAFSAAQKTCQGKTLACTGGLSLSKATIGAILQDSISTVTGANTNWSDVPDSAGNLVASSSLAVTIVNREQGSGSRTAADLFFTGDHCVSPLQSPIKESTGGTADFFSTGNVLAAANTIPGAITYASIDNAGSTSFPNLTLVSVDGVQPSSLNAATGSYGAWFEAQAIPAATLSGNPLTLANAVIGALQNITTGPNTPQVVAIPSAGSPPSYPVSGTATPETLATGYTGGSYSYSIYTNPYTRASNSCNDPEPTL